MFELQIANIELQIPIQDFETAMQNSVDNYSYHMNYNIKPMSTKRGKNMYKLIIDNGNNSEIQVVAERDDINGDICFHPLKLQNMRESFYSFNYDDTDIVGTPEDPCVFFCETISNMCRAHKGSFAYITPAGNPFIIKDGNFKKGASIALVDSDGIVYSCAGAKSVKGATDGPDFSVKKPIGEWLSENTDVQMAIAKLPLDQKMNYIGQYLIKAKLKEEIESDEFMDIFCQAGIFGFSDPSVLNIYKLIM